MNAELESLRQQLANIDESLKLIRERKSEYVQAEDIPLQLIKNERAQEARLAELKARIAELQRPAGAPPPTRASPPTTADLRRVLTERFDDDELNALSMDYYPEVYAKFTLGMNMAQKINLLLDFSRRNPDKGLENLRDTMKRVKPALASVL